MIEFFLFCLRTHGIKNTDGFAQSSCQTFFNFRCVSFFKRFPENSKSMGVFQNCIVEQLIPAQSLLWWLFYFLPTYLRPDKAEAVSGRDCVKIREKILKDYETGSINVLCACDLLNEGLDSPH